MKTLNYFLYVHQKSNVTGSCADLIAHHLKYCFNNYKMPEPSK